MRSIYINRPKGRLGASRATRPLAVIGMTLVEMIVAISVLAVMILAVSQILVQTQRFISAAQKSRRSHAMAFTIARIIRRDVRRISKDGFLHITGSGDAIVLTTAGPASGINESVKGEGSIIAYAGRTCQSSTEKGKTQTYLWRPEFVCYSEGTPSTQVTGERINLSFSSIQRAKLNSDPNSPFTLSQIAGDVLGAAPQQGELKLPPPDAANLAKLWQVLLPAVDDIKISWTDGSIDSGTKNLSWKENGGTWSHENQSIWPRAVRITFKINDPSMPRELRGTLGYKYEVVCAVGQ